VVRRCRLLHNGRITAAGEPATVYQPDLIERVYGLPVEITATHAVPEVRPSYPAPAR
jgi:iron complex transport system ATP-binding protein